LGWQHDHIRLPIAFHIPFPISLFAYLPICLFAYLPISYHPIPWYLLLLVEVQTDAVVPASLAAFRAMPLAHQ